MQEIKKINLSLEWNDVVLKDVLSEKGYIRGPFGSALKRAEMKSEGIPVYEQQNAIYDNRIFRYYIDEEKYQSLKRFTTYTDDLIISCSGTVGKVSIIKHDDPKGIISQALLTLRVNKDLILPEFLKYFFSSYEGYNSLVSRSTGSVQVNISKRAVIEEIPLKLPPLDVQRKIVHYLSLIDKKIETNKKINKNLEQLMKCIFDDWFVNFNYSEDISFKSSELGEIPSNWNVKKLSDVLITLESGKRPKGGISDIEDGIPSIGAENILGLGKFNYSKNKLISHEFFSTLKKGVIQDKDVLLYKDGAQLGRKSLFMKGFPFDICCINEHVFRLQTNDEINQFYLYLWLDQEVMTNEIINLNSNSAQPGINQNDVKSLPILVPELKIISKFNKIISPMMNQIFDNALEINKLTKLRDTLLPKLMSGEIDVSKINCDLELKYNYMKYLFNQIHKQLSKSVV